MYSLFHVYLSRPSNVSHVLTTSAAVGPVDGVCVTLLIAEGVGIFVDILFSLTAVVLRPRLIS